MHLLIDYLREHLKDKYFRGASHPFERTVSEECLAQFVLPSPDLALVVTLDVEKERITVTVPLVLVSASSAVSDCYRLSPHVR